LSGGEGEPDESEARVKTALAGAFVGVAGAAFAVSMLAHLHLIDPWYMARCWPGPEVGAAFIGSLGVWCFRVRDGAFEGCLGMLAAVGAMLLSHAFRVRAASAGIGDWSRVPQQLARSFRWTCWPRLLCYGFGAYIGWFLGTAPGPESRKEAPDGDQTD
jgi:hypothetical protein